MEKKRASLHNMNEKISRRLPWLVTILIYRHIDFFFYKKKVHDFQKKNFFLLIMTESVLWECKSCEKWSQLQEHNIVAKEVDT